MLIDTILVVGTAAIYYSCVALWLWREGRRTTDGLNVKAARGEKLGGHRPYGYNVVVVDGVKTLNE